MFDSLIAASALEAGCDTLYEDLPRRRTASPFATVRPVSDIGETLPAAPPYGTTRQNAADAVARNAAIVTFAEEVVRPRTDDASAGRQSVRNHCPW
jgi:hypothetical protein